MRVPLTRLSPQLAEITGLPPVGYRILWTKIVNGEIRASQEKNGRYTADPYEAAEDLKLPILAGKQAA